jgi:hypothetical protein
MAYEFSGGSSFDHSDEEVGRQEIILEDGKRAYVDWDRAYEVLGTLVEAFYKKDYPYDQEWCVLPEDPKHLPDNLSLGGKEHAMFLWNVCFHMRGWNQSVVAFKHHAELYRDQPEIYDTAIAMDTDPGEIEKLLREHRLSADAKIISKAWVDNSARIQEKWQGDPRSIFEGVTTYKEAIKRVHDDNKGGGFWGFQK